MTIKKIYCLLFFISGSSFFGQVLNNNSLFYTDSAQEFFHFQTEGYFGSTQLPMNFMKTLFRGGSISSDMKENASSKQKALNRIGGEAIGQFSYHQLKPIICNKFGFYATGISQRSVGIEYSEDLYKSVFYGNQAFLNDTINLTQTGLHNRLYNSIQVGLIHQHLKFGVSYISIQTEMNGLIQDGGIYTSTNATQMNAYIDGQLISTNSSSGFFQQSAWGLAFNFEFTNKINSIDSNSNARIIAGLNGVGLQFLSPNTSTYIIDTSYQFQGIHIESISDFSQSILPNNLSDTLHIDQINKSRIGALPFELYIHKIGGKLTSKIHSVYGIRYRSASNYSTLLYLGAEYHINKYFTAGSVLSYGGYAKFQLGSHLRVHKENFTLGFNTNNIIGWFSKNGNGLGINLSASYILK